MNVENNVCGPVSDMYQMYCAYGLQPGCASCARKKERRTSIGETTHGHEHFTSAPRATFVSIKTAAVMQPACSLCM